MHIDFITDTVCPWCYVGKRQLEAALAMRPNVRVDLRYRVFQLNPDMPAGGMDRREYMRLKFGDQGPRAEVTSALKTIGEGLGIHFAFDKIARMPNTLDSHRLIRWGISLDLQPQLVERIFRGYFIEGADIGDRSVLCGLAKEVGMDAELVEGLLESDADVDYVRGEDALARRMGVQGVPAMLIDQRYMIVGAQEPQAIATAIDRILEEQAKPQQEAQVG